MRSTLGRDFDPNWLFFLRLSVVAVLGALAFFYGPFITLVKLWFSLGLLAIAGLSVYFAGINRRQGRDHIDNLGVAAISVLAVAVIWL